MTSTVRVQSGRPHREMLQKPHLHETFFSLKNVGQRPVSVATEFMESDFDDDEILSDLEEGENSPRLSLNSSGQPSITTLSSYEEVQTPRSARARGGFPFDADPKPVEGPRGPHLFRSSTLSAQSIELQNALSLSPVTPKISPAAAATAAGMQIQLPISLDLTPLPNSACRRDSGPFRFTSEELDTCELANWSPEMVAQQMLNAGVDQEDAEMFVHNDITGAILITLRFEDLKELGIRSFGVRHKIWDEIHAMRNIRPTSPEPETEIEDEPDREVRREMRADKPKRRPSRRGRFKKEEIISPLESVSIVGIEQMMPKPHYCKKGENCAKWQRNQRMMEAFKKDHPFVDMDKGGVIMIAGDPGNAATAEALNPKEDPFRPTSDVIPSMVASSDVMGTDGLAPLQYLQEATLRNVQTQDPQDNVRQFLSFQQRLVGSGEVPPTPPFEIYPPQPPQNPMMRTLPKLAIPSQQQPHPLSRMVSPGPHSARPQAQNRISTGSSPDATPTAPYRFGTPFSDMDVPVTAVPLGPVARDASQSVPPDMNYRTGGAPPPRSMSRMSSRRPSVAVLPALEENKVAVVASPPRPQLRRSPTSASAAPAQQRALQAPPRGFQYPWTSERTSFEKAIAPLPGSAASSYSPGSISPGSRMSPAVAAAGGRIGVSKDAEGVTYQGAMRKRKTKLLRHEWHEHYFTLKGTRLAMHKDAADVGRTLEYVDIDDYAIACSGLASTGKLNAAFKAMHIKRGGIGDKQDVAAFSFQLIPQDAKGGVRLLRKRESLAQLGLGGSGSSLAVSGGAAAPNPPGEGVNGTGKSHHFAVKSRDDRIDWMRELMLAKALKQKGEGFEVSVNGNMI